MRRARADAIRQAEASARAQMAEMEREIDRLQSRLDGRRARRTGSKRREGRMRIGRRRYTRASERGGGEAEGGGVV